LDPVPKIKKVPKIGNKSSYFSEMNTKMMLCLLLVACFVSKIQCFVHDLPHFVAVDMHSVAALLHNNLLISLLDLPNLPSIELPPIQLPPIPTVELPQIDADAILPAVGNAGAKLGSELSKSGEVLTSNTLGGVKNIANAVNEISSGIQSIGVPKTQEYFSKLADGVKAAPSVDVKIALPDLSKVQNEALAWKLFPDNHLETGYWENKIKAIQSAKSEDFVNPLGIHLYSFISSIAHTNMYSFANSFTLLGRAVDNFGKRWNDRVASSPLGSINKISIDEEAYNRLLNEAAQTYEKNVNYLKPK